MPHPTVVRQERTAGNVAARPLDVSAASVEAAERRPAAPPRWCRHRHLTAKCSICRGEWEEAMRPAPRRW